MVPARLLHGVGGYADLHSLHALAEVETTHAQNSRSFVERDTSSTCTSLHHFCRNAKDLSDGFHAHTAAIDLGFERSNILGSSLIHVYANHGSLSDALHLLYKMALRDKFTWNYMIKGYVLNGQAYEALQCFDHMQMEGVLPDLFVYASILSGCATFPSLLKGQQIHSIIINTGITLDVVTGTALVNMYGKCRRLPDSLKAFENIREHDTTSWNAIIAIHAQHEQVQEVLDFLHVMQAQGVTPNTVTFIGIIPAFGNPCVLVHGKEVHDLVIAYGFELDVNLANAMISMYGKCGSMEDAWALFESASPKNSLSWTMMIQSAVSNGQSREAFNLFQQMQNEGAIPDTGTYVNLLCVCADLGSLAQGEILHALIMPSAAQGDVNLKNVILNLYSKCGNLEMARAVFDSIVERNISSWNAMLAAYVRHNQNQFAISLFFDLQACKHVPDKVSFLTVISAFSQELGAENERVFMLVNGMVIHSLLVCYGLDADNELGNTLVHMYARHRACKDAQAVFDNLWTRTAVSWNVCIKEKIQETGPAQTFSQMLEEGVMPCEGTFASLMSACDNVFLLKVGKATHARMTMSTSGMDMVMGNRLIDMYQRCGSMNCAHYNVFDCMFERDGITWTQMIGGYTNIGQSAVALDLFDHMQTEGLVADRITYICVLSACASGIAIAKGRILHACIFVSGLVCDVTVGNALLNMYGKCGSMKEAHILFSRMPLVDKVSWSSMITNCAQHGHNKDALEVFKEMQCQQVLPDQITFISILCACSHTGRVVEGYHWFNYMQKDLAIEPTLDHYNCMLDLLGRAGLLSQAEDMIRDMHCEPNMISWMTLLVACRFHMDVDRGERFAEQVFKVNPLDPAPYVILCNIYFAAGMEEQASGIITQMREVCLGQGGLCSLIKNDRKVSEFLDDDFSDWLSEVGMCTATIAF